MTARGRRRWRVAIGLVLVGLLAGTGAACSSADGAAPPATSALPAPATGPLAPDGPVATGVPGHAAGASAGCRATPVPPGTTDLTISSGGKDRAYQLDVPAGYDGTTPYPVVFGLHSLTIDYRIVPGIAGFADMHQEHPFIGVSPSGLVSTAPYWNAAPVPDNADVRFIADLLDHLEQTMCVDTGRVFSVGMSNGAQMSSLLACRLSDRIAGIAPIAGVEFNEPCDGAPVPVIAFHGVEDPIVPYAGGGLSSVRIADQNLYRGAVPAGTATPTGVDESMQAWARHNGCAPDPVETRVSPEVRKRTWQGCSASTEIYLVDNGGHAWPGKPQPSFEKSFGHGTTDIDATSLIWAFWFDHRT